MTKTFRTVSPIKYRELLETIERICIVGNPDEKNSYLNDIYCIAHAFAGHCDNHHEDWRELQEKLREKLKDS